MLKWRRTEPSEPGAGQDVRSPGATELSPASEKPRSSTMCGALTDSGREATDSASLTSSQQSHTSSGACSTCTETSGAPQSDMSLQGALKVPNARRRASAERFEDPLRPFAGGLKGSSRVWGSEEHLASDESVQLGQPVRKTSSVDDLLDDTERPIRGILRKRLPERYSFTPSRPQFIFSRYNPQFRTLPVPRRGQQQPCWPPPDLPVQKSFLSLQKFHRRPQRKMARERRAVRRPTTADIAVLRYDLMEESRSLGYLSATELGDVRYFSQREVKDAQYLLRDGRSEEEDRRHLLRLEHEPPEHRAARQQRRLAASLSDVIRQPSPTSSASQMTSSAARTPAAAARQPPPAPEAREEELLEELVRELVTTPRTLQRWYQAVSAARGLGLILPLYRGLQNRLDPVTLAKLLFKGYHELMQATEDHTSEDPALLCFRQGDVLRVVRRHKRNKHGWWFGVVDGRHGVFPSQLVTPLARGWQRSQHQLAEDLEHGDTEDDSSDSWIAEPPLDEDRQGAESDGDSSNHSQGSGPSADDGKHSLLQYAMTHFRDADERYNIMRDDEGTHTKMLETKNKKNKKKGKEDWTWREQVELVKWTDQPLRVSLLKLDSPEVARLAVESFLATLRYMGDQAMPREVTDVDCVYTVLMACHRFPALRDEVYCQLMRQTTSNRSSQADSCPRGWRLLSLVAAFFACSDSLQPYLTKYLETVAQDPRRAHHRAASTCLQNLRRTLRLGGRRNVPSAEEIAAVTAGCTARRQRYLLPGGTQRVVSTRCAAVVQDVLTELCRELGVTSEEEQEEFSLYCVVEGDAFTLPLSRHEYIIDVTTELQKNQQMFHLVLCRTVWFCPLRLDSPLYVEAVFSQATPDYLEGLLLVMPAETLPQHVVFDIARVAALLHRAAGLRSMPTMKETKYLLPKAALLVRDIKPPQWVNMVQDSWTEVQDKTPAEAKLAVLETLSHWPLFGSAFFVVGAAPESRGDAAADQLLAINSRGLNLLDTVTHETRSRYPFSEVLSTRRVRSEVGDLFIDIKVGTSEQTKVIRLQSENAVEIARLIRQYSGLEQRRRPMEEPGRERQVSR